MGGRLGAGMEDWRPFTVDLKIRKGWHLNAHPAGVSLVPTTIVPVLGKLRGLRYPVESVLEYLAAGDSFEDVLAEFPDLEREDLLACLEFAKRSLQLKSQHLVLG